jgi:hypothetical protein
VNLGTFHLTNEIRVGDLISGGSFLIAAVGLFLNWWQLRAGGIRKRAEFIVSVFNQYITDPDSSQALYDIEYEKFKYGKRFHDSDEEKRLDRLLSYFEKIAALYHMDIITLDDLELVKYDFVRVFQDTNVQRYFETLDSYPAELEGGTFAGFRQVAKLLEPRALPRYSH